MRYTIAVSQRVPSEPRADMRRSASPSFFSYFCAAAIVSSFSLTAALYSAVSSATVASAAAFFARAASLAATASLSALVASSAARRFGSTSSLMSQYTVMLSTKSVRPAAADDFLVIVATLKCSSASSGRMFLKFCLGTWPASMRSLYLSSVSRKPLTSFIMPCDAFHVTSILPLEPSCSR